MQSKKLLLLLSVSFLCGALKAVESCDKTLDQKQSVLVLVNNDESNPTTFTISIPVPAHTAAIFEARFLNLYIDSKLHAAILNDSAQEIRQVIQDDGACINDLNKGRAALLLAIANKKTNAVDALLECGVVIEEKFVEYAINMSDINSAMKIAQKCKFDRTSLYGEKSLLYRVVIFSVIAQDASVAAFKKTSSAVQDVWNRARGGLSSYWSGLQISK